MALRKFVPAFLFTAAAVASLGPAGCSSAETEGTAWSCKTNDDCLGGKLCSSAAVSVEKQTVDVVSSAKRCVAAADAAVVVGVSGLTAEPSVKPAVEACMTKINDEGGIGGQSMRLRWAEFDILDPRGQLENFQTLANIDPASGSRGPQSVDTLFGFLSGLDPAVADQLAAQGLAMFGSTEGSLSYRDGRHPNLYFWRPSFKDEMDAIMGLIIPGGAEAGITDPKKIYLTHWSIYNPSVLPELVTAWNDRVTAIGGADAKTVDFNDKDNNFGFYHLEKNDTAPAPGASYGTYVSRRYLEESIGLDPRAEQFVAQETGKRAFIVLDAPASAAGLLAALHRRFLMADMTVEKRNEISVYIYSKSGSLLPVAMDSIVAGSQASSPGITAAQLIGEGLKRTRVTSVVPNPEDPSNPLAAAYASTVPAQHTKNQSGFEAYLSCLYFSEVLRKSMATYGSVDTEYLLQTLRGDPGTFSTDVTEPGNSKTIDAGKNYVGPPTIYVYDYTSGDVNKPDRVSRWENGALSNLAKAVRFASTPGPRKRR